ncbi:small conductance mechanosensitive channel [Azospirillum oryzae]|uniref:Small conductance mechanosensitive channel n=1 Tax=Azospirillum oryzae TaxID=286727 RepID=A0A1X7FKS2_9PROT|nr:mechanosensitive ion channel domain-containing protein [Azospirillum oryzae]SMF53485.1 small conductance mechanosensitive channel [Azospirillum oryzae]
MAFVECSAQAPADRRGRTNRLFTTLICLVFLCLSVVATAGSAFAQAMPAAPVQAQDPSPKEIGRLIDSLETPAKREALLDQLKALQQAEQAAKPDREPEGLGTRLLTMLSSRLDDLGEEVRTTGEVVLNAPQGMRWLQRQAMDPARQATWAWLFAELVLVVLAGHAARLVATRLLRRPRSILAARPFGSAIAKIPLLLVRALMDLAPIAAFAVAGFGVLVLIDPPSTVRLLGVAFLNASLFVQVVVLVMRGLLSPRSSNLRLIPMDDAAARRLLVWSRAIAFSTVYGLFAAGTARTLGLPEQSYVTLVKLVGLADAIMLTALVLQSRAAVASWLRGEISSAPAPVEHGQATVHAAKTTRPGRLLRAAGRRLANVWHAVAILYIVALFGIWALEVEGGLWFVLRATAVSLVAVAIARMIGRGIARGSTALRLRLDRQRSTWGDRRIKRYIGPGTRVLHWGLAGVTGLVVLDAWGLDVRGTLETAMGWRFLASGLAILLVAAIALAVWELTNAVIERNLATTDRYGHAIQRSARIRTLLPLLRNALMVVLLTFVTLITLSELGLDIGPLLAGAGVVGLAVGFGAQTLVKDVITGLFILFEDTISVGDVVNVGGKGGLVEGITIRTIRLRDFDGTVHTVPFSAVTSISNMTKDFSFYVFDVTVAYREDVDRVVSVLHEIGAGMRADQRFAPLILEPLEVLGIDAFRDSAVLIKARIKTLPIQQWNVGREFNGRMKKRFDELGITIPFPQRTLHIAPGSLAKASAYGEAAE